MQGNIATLRDGAEINDWAHVVLNYPAHKVILHCSMLVAGGSSRFTVHGDKGSVIKARADQQESQLLAGVVPGSAGWGEDDDPLVIYDASLQAHAQATPQGDQRQYYMLIRDALKGQIANPVPPVEALAVMAVLEAAVRSAESGMVQTTGPVRRRAQHAALIRPVLRLPARPAGNRYFCATLEKSLSIRRLTLLYPAPWRKAPLEISANWEEDRMQIDPNEKEVADAVDAATVLPDRRSACITR